MTTRRFENGTSKKEELQHHHAGDGGGMEEILPYRAIPLFAFTGLFKRS